MSKIFLCYRREDSEYPAHSVHQALRSRFGDESIVFDVDSIPLGRDFREYITKQVGECDALLAVIGDHWLELLNQRLDDPTDFVRFEIETALERDIPVVPVLVGKASVPSEQDLPDSLSSLAFRQATEVRAGPDLNDHLARLISGLEKVLEVQTAVRVQTGQARPQPARHPILKTEKGAPTWEEDELLNPRILLEGGRFLMGSPKGVVYRDEQPQHYVTLSPFYLLS